MNQKELRETMQLALEAALPYVVGAYECAFPDEDRNQDVEQMLRAALAAARSLQAHGEEVAWMWEYDSVGHAVVDRRAFTLTPEPTQFLRNVFARGPWPLYTHIAQAVDRRLSEWGSLTNEQVLAIAPMHGNFSSDEVEAFSAGFRRCAQALAASAPCQAEPECVVCTRCGHENWIQDGKAPCQVKASRQAEPMINGLTEEETSATASVVGLTPRHADPFADGAWMFDGGEKT